MTRLFLGLLWLLHWLPFPVLGALGHGLGRLLWWANRERRKAVDLNLRLCFPAMDEATRRTVAKAHFVLFAQSALERCIQWWAPASRLRRLIRLEGLEHLPAADADEGIILLAPHFIGLDMGWSRLSLERNMAAIYARVRNPLLNEVMRRGRTRFGRQLALSRQEGLKPAIAALRKGTVFHYSPDMDYGTEDAIFVPFFGIPAATLSALPRLARIGRAKVFTVVTRRHRWGYVTRIQPAWDGYPSTDLANDVSRMNREIEAQILADGTEGIAQYFWSHKRFKSRPPGEPYLY